MNYKAQILIIGNGISGVTTARQIRKKSSVPITIVSEEHSHFFSRTALMYVYMGHMPFSHTEPYEKNFWKKNNIQLIQDRVESIAVEQQQILLKEKGRVPYTKLVIASGSKPNFFGWPGEDLQAVQGFYHKADLESLEKWSEGLREAVIVGGGLIGIELAEMLHSRNIPVHFLVRESSFWNTVLPAAESAMINEEIRRNGIDLQLNTELKAILSDTTGRVRAVETTEHHNIPCQWVGLSVGVHPNIDFLKNSGIAFNRGILVNRFLETNIPNVYAVGDCAEHKTPPVKRRPVESVWYTGQLMGACLAKTLTGNPTVYAPGHWFNSAKFFNIEYQTYGWVSAQPEASREAHLLWQHPTQNNLLRLAYDPQSREFLGVNALGLRLRHESFDRWLTEKRKIQEVIDHLEEANFDPEFHHRYEPLIKKAFKKALS